MNKKGISLIVLVITIVLMIILVGITTVSIGNGVQNAKKTSFANDLSAIGNSLETYYLQNGNFPVLEENGKYIEYEYGNNKLSSKSGEVIYLNSEFLNEFKAELIKNLDLSEGENIVSDTVFYKIDLSKIGVKKIRRGTGKDGENDIYVMAYPSQTIYYLKGLKVNDKIYFSLVNILNTKRNEISDEEVIVQTSENIRITKIKKSWTNKLGITISANLKSNEKLYIKLPVRESEIALSTITGENSIIINSLSGSLGITEEELNNFNNLNSSEKIMNVIKRTDGVEIVNIKVDISNYETEIPSFPLKEDGVTFDFNITSYNGYNEVSFIGNDKISGIKEVRYVYLTEFGNNFLPQTLYEDTSILTSEYMLQNGKKAYVSNNGNVIINLPKDVEAIYITMYDKAGNSVSMQKNVQTDTYIRIDAINISNNLKFNIGILSNKVITSAKALISLNGNDFIDEKELILTKDSNNIYSSVVEFENSKDKEVYIKVIAYDNSDPQNEEIRIKKFNLEEVATKLVSSVIPGLTYEENRYYTDKNGDKAIVPAGFRVSLKSDEQTIDDGLVILDKKDNEFVWIPVDGVDLTYTKKIDEYPKHSTLTNISDDIEVLPMKNETTRINENDQITKYGGFYIGRYESGVPDNQTEIDGTSADTSNKVGIPVIKKGAKVWTCIDYINSNINAKSFLNTDNIKSGLVTGTQWDTVCEWISNSGISVTDSRTWGNYKDSLSPADVTGYGSKQTAGYSEYWKAKNIYDLAGNTWEWTGEKYLSNSIFRGGSYNYSGSYSPASYRSSRNPFLPGDDFSFRIVLYVL